MFEYYKELKKYKLELKKKYLQKKWLLNKDTDFGLLEDIIQQCNNNPGLTVTVKLGDGTVLELKTMKDKPYTNPLFTEAAFLEG